MFAPKNTTYPPVDFLSSEQLAQSAFENVVSIRDSDLSYFQS
jgi:hypothetical protein